MSRYAFLRERRWILLTIAVIVAVVVMVNLGLWQLRRYHERQSLNDKIEQRSHQTALPVNELVPTTATDDDIAAVRYDAVRAVGTYDASRTHVVASRTQAEGPGGWVVSPMNVDGNDVFVLRGFERLQSDGSLPSPAPPVGTVTVTGYVMQVSRYDPIAKKDFTKLLHDDPNALPVVVQLATSDPSDDPSLEIVPLPPLDEGPYLGYAVQWFLFCIVAVCGWFLLAWRHAERGREQAAERDGARAA